MNEKLIVEKEEKAGVATISLKGILDGSANLDELFTDTPAKIVVNLRDVQYINAQGIGQWLRAINALPKNKKLALQDCLPQFVRKCNVIQGFRGDGEIQSFMAPYHCAPCDREFNVKLTPEKHFKGELKIPKIKCPKCQDPLVFASVPEKYFDFMERGREA